MVRSPDDLNFCDNCMHSKSSHKIHLNWDKRTSPWSNEECQGDFGEPCSKKCKRFESMVKY